MNIADVAAIINSGGGGGGGGAGGGFDFVIKCDNTTSTAAYSLDSGDFDKVVQKIQNYECLTGYCFNFNTINKAVGSNLIFTGASYSEEDDYIDTSWRTLVNNPPLTVVIIWERDGRIYED